MSSVVEEKAGTVTPASTTSRFRNMLRRGAVATSTVAVGAQGQSTDSVAAVKSSASAGAIGVVSEVKPAPPPTKVPEAVADGQAPSKMSARELLRQRQNEEKAAHASALAVKKNLASVRMLTKLLEAVYTKPGSHSPEADRIEALATLAKNMRALGDAVVHLSGEPANDYRKAMAMDASVGLVTKQWSEGLDVNWQGLIEATLARPEIVSAAHEMSNATYLRVNSKEDMAERLLVSLHSAFWKVYSLGQSVDGITPKLSAEIVQNCSDYLQNRERFIADNDLHTSWLQGSIGRITDLVCAEIKAQFANKQAPSEADIKNVLNTARGGFEGVENYAQSILEVTVPHPEHRPSA